MTDRLDYYVDKAGEWRWHRLAPNGEILSQGESHDNRWDAMRAAVRANPDLVNDPDGDEAA